MDATRIVRHTLIVLLLLMIPLIGMQINADIRWGLFDFVIAGGILFAARLAYEAIRTRLFSTSHRIWMVVGISLVVMVVWLELAVGIVGTPFAGS
ncbi:MAG: hypothetical protein FJ040_02005 [Chloroflexi bacterium]|nr:hypothetical protein [Chloroflexota bacterium]